MPMPVAGASTPHCGRKSVYASPNPCMSCKSRHFRATSSELNRFESSASKSSVFSTGLKSSPTSASSSSTTTEGSGNFFSRCCCCCCCCCCSHQLHRFRLVTSTFVTAAATTAPTGFRGAQFALSARARMSCTSASAASSFSCQRDGGATATAPFPLRPLLLAPCACACAASSAQSLMTTILPPSGTRFTAPSSPPMSDRSSCSACRTAMHCSAAPRRRHW
ncbi:uncharacterized protein K452DRAFT_286552 [Aplosporella prunicola CBS 121167]|uniref:Uncharacterized protein n=1 Tax=Aplosporella prunicola CBS 121167 TaxID=1176127 RepID=A0A6A6BFH5_9PEZI|nr:uncharacterized protein K452DRAFT_286552 [Aplosporella prunicola CBS 121167]KAF2142920.1 hypothetical protein K452DRAFT_286552 [Aplosporella prunicola CBS 121167]